VAICLDSTRTTGVWRCSRARNPQNWFCGRCLGRATVRADGGDVAHGALMTSCQLTVMLVCRCIVAETRTETCVTLIIVDKPLSLSSTCNIINK
jgi:hypothetical protein